MKQLLLKTPGFLGDEVVFTGVVRELKLQTGWQISVKTTRPDLWLGNSYVTNVNPDERALVFLDQDHCPAYYKSNQTPVHFLEQYVRDIRAALNVEGNPRVTKFAGEVLPTPDEILSPPYELPPRYWIIVAGWKNGMPIKAWPVSYCQEVVDSMRGRVAFVQAGVRSSWHPPLRGVTNVVGKTTLRQLISLIYHAEGILCPITSIMHLAAAIPASEKSVFKIRPCVVVAGGREAPHYINYPMHRVLHLVGQMDCCARGGCGKSHFGPGQCPYPVQEHGETVPRCMTLIKPADVVAAIEFYYRGDASLPPRLGKVEALHRRLQRYGGAQDALRGLMIGGDPDGTALQMLRGDHRLHLTLVLNSPPLEADCDSPPDDKTGAFGEFEDTRYRFITTPMKEAQQQIKDGSIDFICMTDVQAEERHHRELNQWSKKLKPGGFICGFGYDRPSPFHQEVKRAVDEFATLHKKKVARDKDNSWFIDNLS
jgi:hypothetical protein